MARHCFEVKHSYNNVKASLLYPCEKGSRMNKLEEIYTLRTASDSNIKKSFTVLNDMQAVFFNYFIRFMLKD